MRRGRSGERGGGREEEEEGEVMDMSQYASQEEIHVAAMEGVKASAMRKLVRNGSMLTSSVFKAYHFH